MFNNGCIVAVIDGSEDVIEVSVDCRRPRWAIVVCGYIADLELGYWDGIFNEGKVSAVRVFIAITASQMMESLFNDKERRDPRAVTMIKSVSFMGRNVIADVRKLKEWLSEEDVWREPDTTIDCSEVRATNKFDFVQNKIKNEKGVLIIFYCKDQNDRATLWTGDDIIDKRGRDYIGGDSIVHFWSLEKNDRCLAKTIAKLLHDTAKKINPNLTGKDLADLINREVNKWNPLEIATSGKEKAIGLGQWKRSTFAGMKKNFPLISGMAQVKVDGTEKEYHDTFATAFATIKSQIPLFEISAKIHGYEANELLASAKNRDSARDAMFCLHFLGANSKTRNGIKQGNLRDVKLNDSEKKYNPNIETVGEYIEKGLKMPYLKGMPSNILEELNRL